MKLISAVIKPSRLDAVLEAVTEAGASGLTVTEVRGYGRQKGKTEIYRGAEYEVKLLPKVKIEIAAPSDIVEAVVEAIARSANSGQIGDGKVFVVDLESALRIRTALNLAGDDVILASSLPHDSVVKIAAASPDQLISAAQRLSQETLGKLKDPGGALVFDCAARMKLLGGRYREQVAAFGSAKPVPYLGFASYGELAKGTGQLTVFHNTTAVMAAF